MKKLFNNQIIHTIAFSASVAVLLSVTSVQAAHAAPYTIFGQDNSRSSLTNSSNAESIFRSSVSDASSSNSTTTSALDSLLSGARNVIYADAVPLVSVLGSRDIQYGLDFTVGGSTVYARSSRVTETYVLGLFGAPILSGTTAPQYDDGIFSNSLLPRAFGGTAISGTNFMGGENKPDLHFDFGTDPNSGAAFGVKAFGFYGIDAGDTAATNLTVTVDYADNTSQTFAVKPGGFTGTEANNNAFFFGVVTPDKPFTGVTIHNPNASSDAISYDNFVMGTQAAAVVIPEAGTLAFALPALGIIGTVLVRRRATV